MILVAGIILFPSIRDALQPLPATFGEVNPPRRPTVTPLPGANGAPIVLPETPLVAPNQTLPIKPPDQPLPTDRSAKIPTRIVIPAIHLNAPIETVGWSQIDGMNTWDVPNYYAAGWLKTSAPVGQGGNTVLDGHHNIAGEVFRYLIDLKAGDLIELYSNAEVFSYHVLALVVLPDRDEPIDIRQQNAQWVQPTDDTRLTLVTCWPYSSNTYRLIIVAQPIATN